MSIIFDWTCSQIPIPLCTSIKKPQPICVSRNLQFGKNFFLFHPGSFIIALLALGMTFVMILNIRRKVTAYGRKQIVQIFYWYAVTLLSELLLVSGLIPTGLNAKGEASALYSLFAAFHLGTLVASFGALLANSFMPFRTSDDNSRRSVWTVRIFGLLSFGVTIGISAPYFMAPNAMGWAAWPVFVLLALPVIFALFYFAIQMIYLSTDTELQSKLWPFGSIVSSLVLFCLSISTYCILGGLVCKFTSHYVDALFLGDIFMLGSTMMLYKYWDVLTDEDLELTLVTSRQPWKDRNHNKVRNE